MDCKNTTESIPAINTGAEETTIATEEEPPKSLVQLFAERSVKLREIQTKIANNSTAVITHPEINMKKLRDMLSMFDIRADDKEFGLIFFSIQKMVALAALEVFKDIIPQYRVKEKINEEEDELNAKRKNFRLKKETKRLREYEKSLIQLYRLYLNRLQRMVDCVSTSKAKRSDFYDQMLSSAKAKQRLATIGLKCMSQLVSSHPHFNFRQQIVETLVEMMANNKFKQLSEISCQTVAKIYRTDKLGEISLEAVKATAKLAKQRNYMIAPAVLKTFLSLHIREVKQKEELNKKDMKRLRVKLNLMSRKERKRNKRMAKLDNQLLETEAQESHKRRLDFHTEILNQIFVTYFRILKNQRQMGFTSVDNSNSTDSSGGQQWFKAILTPVLEGLSKFAHLINFEFFDDLISLLYELIKDKRLDSRQTLHCMLTVFTILAGEGQALNIDFQQFYTELYVQLLTIDTNTDLEDIRVLIQTLYAMIIKRKKQMTTNRVFAYIKRLATVSMQTQSQPTIALLAVVRQLMLNHSKSDILLDSEAMGIGNGVFMPEVDDPEHCNANSTLVWELTTLNKHYDPLVRQFAEHVLNGSKGNELPISAIKSEPMVVFNGLVENFSDFDVFHRKQEFNTKRQKLNNSFINSNTSLSSKCLSFVNSIE